MMDWKSLAGWVVFFSFVGFLVFLAIAVHYTQEFM
jgi:hypothetical protein